MKNNHLNNGKTAKILGLFMATALAVMPGCTNIGHTHVDRNGDGYCDEDGQPMNSSTGGRSHYYGGSSGRWWRSGTNNANNGTPSMSKGTAAPKGGIGSFSLGGGG